GDALAAEFAGDGLGEAEQAGLGGGVVGLAGVADDAAGGADVDDAAELAAHHGAGGRADGDEGGGQVGLDDHRPILVGHAEGQAVLGDAGVIDEDVESAVSLGGGGDRGGESGRVSDVHGEDRGGAPGLFDCGLDL